MWNRREFLAGTGLAATAATAAPLLGRAAARAAGPPADLPDPDPDQLFRAGCFAAADRGYAALLRADPDNAHALVQRGYFAAMGNRFAAAEQFLTRAIRLAPGDAFAKGQLADCYTRQDRLARAVPLLRDSGREPYATLYASVTGPAFATRGARATRLPWVALDPLPMVEASVNGGPPRPFVMDTGAPLVLSTAEAERAGLRAVATVRGGPPGQVRTQYLGVASSFRLGDIELRNVPLLWDDDPIPAPPGGPRPAGVIGTWIFCRFVTTMDYANRVLVLRHRTADQVRQVRAEARRAGATLLPLWLALDHVPFTMGSINGYGPRVARLDTGAAGLGVIMTEEKAKRAGVPIDYAHPITANGAIVAYPIAPDTMSLGTATGRHVPGIAGPISIDDEVRFETLADFAHEFFKPFALTFDYATMTCFVSRPVRPGGG
ncbi:MAG: aspartyl protease family protein [Mycobacteriales bacterium]